MTTVTNIIEDLSKLPPNTEIINIWWDASDVKQTAKDDMEYILTDEQTINIINSLEENFDASIGIDWQIIQYAIQDEIA